MCAKDDRIENKIEFKIFTQLGKLLAYYVTLFPTFHLRLETDSDAWLKELEKHTKSVPLLEAENVLAIPEKFVEIFMGSKKFTGLNFQAYRICNNFQLYADFLNASLRYVVSGRKDRRAGVKIFNVSIFVISLFLYLFNKKIKLLIIINLILIFFGFLIKNNY